jgi:hypothetical protein
MTTLTKNRILEKGDQFFNGTGWVPIPTTDFGLQVAFAKYKEIRRPSETVKDLPAQRTAEDAIHGELEAPVDAGNTTATTTTTSIDSDEAAGLDIKFPKTKFQPVWMGRNGCFNGYALSCIQVKPDKILLQPVGKRGVGNCMIEFPKAIIPQLVDWLLQQELEK